MSKVEVTKRFITGYTQTRRLLAEVQPLLSILADGEITTGRMRQRARTLLKKSRLLRVKVGM